MATDSQAYSMFCTTSTKPMAMCRLAASAPADNHHRHKALLLDLVQQGQAR